MGDVTYINEHRKLSTVKDESTGTIHCLVVSVNGESILLPNAAVAEVVNYIDPEVVNDAPEWLLGLISWRERRLPLISFEKVSGSHQAYPGNGDRIVICNSLNGNRNVPYVGLVAQGIPHLMSVKEENLTDAGQMSGRQCIAMTVQVASDNMLIPNLDEIESRIQTLQS